MDTIANDIKRLAKENGLKMYEVSNLMGITQNSFYNTYMHSNDQSKLQRVIDVINDYQAKAGADNE